MTSYFLLILSLNHDWKLKMNTSIAYIMDSKVSAWMNLHNSILHSASCIILHTLFLFTCNWIEYQPSTLYYCQLWTVLKKYAFTFNLIPLLYPFSFPFSLLYLHFTDNQMHSTITTMQNAMDQQWKYTGIYRNLHA